LRTVFGDGRPASAKLGAPATKARNQAIGRVRPNGHPFNNLK
jgi:hypothetical protein